VKDNSIDSAVDEKPDYCKQLIEVSIKCASLLVTMRYDFFFMYPLHLSFYMFIAYIKNNKGVNI
jgi:hypothetical protein